MSRATDKEWADLQAGMKVKINRGTNIPHKDFGRTFTLQSPYGVRNDYWNLRERSESGGLTYLSRNDDFEIVYDFTTTTTQGDNMYVASSVRTIAGVHPIVMFKDAIIWQGDPLTEADLTDTEDLLPQGIRDRLMQKAVQAAEERILQAASAPFQTGDGSKKK